MEIKTLDNVSIAEIARTFNAAFIDYKVKFQMTEASMGAKIHAENIQLKHSAAAFDGDQLVGFILNATDVLNEQKFVYNAGTGVLPAYRGQHVADKMYDFSIAALKGQGFVNHLLEVFDDNTKAIALYEKKGFTKKRKMLCYKAGKPSINLSYNNVCEVELNPELFASFWDVTPSWQNNLQCIQRNLAEHTIIGIKQAGEIVAYAIYVQQTGRLKQVAVKHAHRRQGLARQLLSYISNHMDSKEVVLTCVEENTAVDSFLHKLGFSPFIGMFEMELVVE